MGLVSRLGGALDDDDDDRPDAPLAATEGVAVMTQYWPFAFGYALLSPSVVGLLIGSGGLRFESESQAKGALGIRPSYAVTETPGEGE